MPPSQYSVSTIAGRFAGRERHPVGTPLFYTASMNTVSYLRDTKGVGNVSELVVMSTLAAAGFHVALPLGDSRRYDLIIDKDGVLSRVQVKTGRFRNGAVVWHCCSSHTHRGGTSARSYVGEVDFFGVYCSELNAVYLIPIGNTSRLHGSIRLHPTRNNQQKGIRLASPYLVCSDAAPQLMIGVGMRDGVAVADALEPS